MVRKRFSRWAAGTVGATEPQFQLSKATVPLVEPQSQATVLEAPSARMAESLKHVDPSQVAPLSPEILAVLQQSDDVDAFWSTVKLFDPVHVPRKIRQLSDLRQEGGQEDYPEPERNLSRALWPPRLMKLLAQPAGRLEIRCILGSLGLRVSRKVWRQLQQYAEAERDEWTVEMSVKDWSELRASIPKGDLPNE